MKTLPSSAVLAVLLALCGNLNAAQRQDPPALTQSLFATPSVQFATPGATTGTFTPYARLKDYLDTIARTSDAKLYSLLTTAQGREVWALRLGNPQAKVRVMVYSRVHGDEPAASEGALAFLDALTRGELNGRYPDVELVVVPMANPDGAVAMKRATAQGGDIVTACNTVPFASPVRLVEVRAADKLKKADAEQLKSACQGGTATAKKVERRDKSEKPPALYDLTTLQRDANRLLGFTAQQTLDYLQSLYEKKLCTYPRTDSRYLTGDMADSLPVLVNLVANAMPFRKGIAITCDPQTVINDKKVTDHHAVIPTRNLKDADLSALPAGEKAVLELVALRLLCAVAQPHIYSETVVIAACAGGEFTAKGKTVKHPGWKALEDAYRAKMKDAEPKKEGAEKALPELTEGQTLSVAAAIVKEGKSSPPQHFTEDTLLSAMETAGKEDMPEDAERKGLGTPATRAGILEKLVSAGFLERKKSRKTVQLLPSHDAVSLITVLPEQLQSPLLTAEWEYRLGEIERGQLAPEEFLDGISTMLKDLVGTYQVIKGTEYLFTPPREVVGKCPRCGGEVAELQKGFFCQNDSCKFAIWKNNKWWAAKKKQPTKAVVSALLNDGRVRVTGLYSEKTGKTYDATVVLEDDGQYANFKLEFDQRKGGSR